MNHATMETVQHYLQQVRNFFCNRSPLSNVATLIVLGVVIHRFIKRLTSNSRKKALKNKVVWITGATSGIGEACAHEFFKCGAKVILSGRSHQRLREVRDAIVKDQDVSVEFIPQILPFDLQDSSSKLHEVAGKAVSIHDVVDILINNAGITNRGSVVDTDVAVQRHIMEVNYFAPMTLIKALLPKMIERREGHLICVSSVQGKIGLPYRSAYSASKHACQAFYDSLRAEVARYNIKVLVVSPGYVRTNLSRNALTHDGSKYGILDKETDRGMSSTLLAELIAEYAADDEKDVVIANPVAKIGIFLRYMFPSVYFWLMSRRARKN